MLSSKDKDRDTAQVAHELLQLKDGGLAGEFDAALAERYGITFENFHKLVYDLLPMCDRVRTKYGEYSGLIAEDGTWLAGIANTWRE